MWPRSKGHGRCGEVRVPSVCRIALCDVDNLPSACQISVAYAWRTRARTTSLFRFRRARAVWLHLAREGSEPYEYRIGNGNHYGAGSSRARRRSDWPSERKNPGPARFFRRSEGMIWSETSGPIVRFRQKTLGIRPSNQGNPSPQFAKRSVQGPDFSPQIRNSCEFDRRVRPYGPCTSKPEERIYDGPAGNPDGDHTKGRHMSAQRGDATAERTLRPAYRATTGPR
ncbi:hypothetical protein D2E24_1283 [Bifidobacterium samirii]|uniref:Uncharacterized protein n=1 Tax=Bifidobacterium samirii TaxID=2306974 RepID=A0A430FR98_9BIFI|nr:hypothetical protein D2E24_1283 [Bifidobacterium samirii]